MSDYFACDQELCKKKFKCARYLMKHSEHQLIITITKPRTCDAFWPVESTKKIPFDLDPDKLRLKDERDD